MFGKENVVYLLAESTNVLNGKYLLSKTVGASSLNNYTEVAFIEWLFSVNLGAWPLYQSWLHVVTVNHCSSLSHLSMQSWTPVRRT